MPPDRDAITDRSVAALGTEVRLAATTHGGGARRVQRAMAMVRRAERVLTRFDPASELSQLNADPRETVPASATLRNAISAALWAARRSDGLVDPTLLDDLLRCGYTASFSGATTPTASDRRPAPAAAQPRPRQRWREISVDDATATVTRPPGLHLDLGGSGKGHIADRAADVLQGAQRWLVDCGGDLRTGGSAGTQEVIVAMPDGQAPVRLNVTEGAVATSGVHRRRWRSADGRPMHHLLDPATGAPAWTGLIQVTALAPTTLEAETLAKTALLRGPAAAPLVLTHGGILVHDTGDVEHVAPRSSPHDWTCTH